MTVCIISYRLALVALQRQLIQIITQLLVIQLIDDNLVCIGALGLAMSAKYI